MKIEYTIRRLATFEERRKPAGLALLRPVIGQSLLVRHFGALRDVVVSRVNSGDDWRAWPLVYICDGKEFFLRGCNILPL